ncbi:MAG: flagellar biosynthetic protein FliR [candidate division Zixibacteria bacterium]|nr:flagellar biosynthetic protein FliR [candidate division Zixibacteria bacterium]
MFEFINYTADKLQLLLVIVLRLSGIFLIAPVWSHNSFPNLVKIGLMILLALILVSVLQPVELPEVQSLWQLAGLALKEIMVGFVIGLFFQIIFYGVQTAGSMIGYQVGLAIATEFDPEMAGQVSLLGRFWFLVATLIFITINGHHLVISAFVDSYLVIPAGGVSMAGGVGELIIKYTAYVFVVAVKIAAPVMITLFLTDVALGTIAKTMPTMNVFFVGFPIKIAVGLVVMAISLPMVSYVLEKSVGYLDQELKLMFLAMGRA